MIEGLVREVSIERQIHVGHGGTGNVVALSTI